ncbi:MAG: SMC-Scp complex subunit ScpB [archaeon]|mgnify:CR=1 FL=1
MDKKESKKMLEAALFMSPGVVALRDLAKSINSNVAETRVLVNELMHEYESRDSSIEIRDEAGGIRMTVRRKYEDNVGHMAASPELNKGIMKTLAYIAYKQPVKQSEVINFRNSKAYEHIRVLREKGFIKKDKKGITYIINTTPKFREYFASAAKKSAVNAQSEKEIEGLPEDDDSTANAGAGNPEKNLQ